MGYHEKRMSLSWLMMTILLLLCVGGKWGVFVVQAQIHHVVGDDRGWDIASDIASWASGRSFAVGDFIWFAYAGGIDKDKVVELKTKEEFESCDLRSPIKMYTDGLDKIPLDEEGIRYFASSNIDSCKQGLKLPVDIKSKSTAENATMHQSASIASSERAALMGLAEEPTSPSSSSKICGSVFIIMGGFILRYVAL